MDVTGTQVIPLTVALVHRNYVTFAGEFPAYGNGDSTYKLTPNKNWLAAFWSGMLWLIACETGDAADIARARSVLPSFAARLDNDIRLNHDIGFLFTLSARAQWQITGDAHAHALALRAADVLLARFRPAGNYILAWDNENGRDDRGRFIIDTMMNLPLLFWAGRETDNTRYSDAAHAHALTSLRYLMRADGSAYHTYYLDPDNGTPIGPRTHQGYADDSLWARGQSWAIYGFTLAAEWTGDERLLTAAKSAATCYLAEAPDDAISPWDYRLPDDATAYPDSSADAIATGGLLRLAALTGDESYRNHAEKRLRILIDKGLDTRETAQGLLRHGTQHAPHNYGVNTYTIFGDYFFLEAIMNFTGNAPDFWGPNTK